MNKDATDKVEPTESEKQHNREREILGFNLGLIGMILLVVVVILIITFFVI